MKTHRIRDYLGVGAEHRLLCFKAMSMIKKILEEDNGRNGNSWADAGTQRPGQPQHSHSQGQEACFLRNYSQ